MTIPLLFPWCDPKRDSRINALNISSTFRDGLSNPTARPSGLLRLATPVRFREVSKQEGELPGQMIGATLAVPVGSDKIIQGMICTFARATLHSRDNPDLPRGESREER